MAKKEPVRTCIGCREARPKSELIRIIRTPEGKILIDTEGKANGRGAYTCLEEQCIKAVLKGDTLAKALKVKPSEINKETLAQKLYEIATA